MIRIKLYFGGAEISGWRDLLSAEGVQDMSMSFVGLARRKDRTWPFTDDQHIFIDSGAHSFNKEGSKYSEVDAAVMSDNYLEFLRQNANSADMVSEFDAQMLGKDHIENMRSQFYNDLGDKFLPVWHEEYGLEELEKLCSKYSRVGVTQTALAGRDIENMLNSLVSRYGVKLHGVGITHMDSMKSVKWDSVGSTSWLNTVKYGETFVWTGRELKWYPVAYKDQSRKRHRTLFEDNGFDPAKIAADDKTEVLRLSIWSWTQYVNDINSHRGVTPPENTPNPQNQEHTGTEVVIPFPSRRNEQLIQDRPTVAIPVMGMRWEKPDDDSDAEHVPVFESRSKSMRMCNTCFLKAKCPGFSPDVNCLYDMPIEVRTPLQMKAWLDGLVEMQAHRVLFMKMTEDIEGGYADPNLSNEIRLAAQLIKQKQESERETLVFRNETTITGGQGVLTAFFGKEVADKANAPQVVEAEVIRDSNDE